MRDLLSQMTPQNLFELKELIKNHKYEAVNRQQFVACMKMLLDPRQQSPHLASELIDLFSRINVRG